MALSAGEFLQSCALMKFGGVYCWGNNYRGQLGTGDTIERLVPTPVVGLVPGTLISCKAIWSQAMICTSFCALGFGLGDEDEYGTKHSEEAPSAFCTWC